MKLNYISVLRSLSILTVVFFHTYQYMYAVGHFPDTAQLYHDTYFWFIQCVGIQIAMPMFTLISGFLFSWLYDRGRYREFLPMTGKKALRLLLPYFVFGTLMMATIGVPFRPWELFRGGFSHLWYLPVLFWCFPLGWCVKRWVRIGWAELLVLVVFLAGTCLRLYEYFPPVLGIGGVTRWFGWFLLGMLLATHQERVLGVVSRFHLAVPLLIPFAVQACVAPVEYGDQTWWSMLCVTCFLVGFWSLSAGCEAAITPEQPVGCEDSAKERNAEMSLLRRSGGGIIRLCRPLVSFSKYSFGVYIFHNWIGPYMISNTAKRLFPLQELAADHVILFPLLLTLSVIFVSWCLSWALMRTKVGRMLIG